MRWRLFCWMIISTVSMYVSASSVRAQDEAPAIEELTIESEATTAPTTEPVMPATLPSGIPLAELAAQSESTLATLRSIETTLANDRVVDEITTNFDALSREIDPRLEESSRLLSPSPSLDTLRSLDSDWRNIGEELTDWGHDLAARLDELNRDQWQLYERQLSWNETLYNASISATEPQVINRINGLLENIWRLQRAISARWNEVLTLQGKLASKAVQVSTARDAVRQTYERAVQQLLTPDSPPVWTADAQRQGSQNQNLTEQSRNSLHSQLDTVRVYAERHRPGFATHVLIIGLLAALMYWMRAQSRKWIEREPGLAHVA
ncbi:MAG TPA: hypothetical protein PK402_12905, partial [Tepidisphaeraceae bacterium]|nr:hypothetical protein [Tepidisphaeraceae bacterium]